MVCNESIYHARCLVVLCFVAVVILVPTAFTPRPPHYNDIIMTAMASQITSLMIVYSTVYSGADQRKHQSSVSLAFVRGIHRWPVNPLLIGPVTRKMFLFDDVIMRRHLYHNRITACVLNVLIPFFSIVFMHLFPILARQSFTFLAFWQTIKKKLLCYSQYNEWLGSKLVEQSCSPKDFKSTHEHCTYLSFCSTTGLYCATTERIMALHNYGVYTVIMERHNSIMAWFQ